jgi:voltage-gated potassium channel
MNKRLGVAFAILFLTLVIGATGYHFLEGFSIFQALYLTVVTISTVGYGDVYARSTGGWSYPVFVDS